MAVIQLIHNDNLLWLECLIRIVMAVILGFTIGTERQLRLKVAGIRTHAIVAVGGCLFTIISICAFPGHDTSRVAAQVVSGIGFIGAGMILHKQNAVHGLTSAAAIWLTAAIGMATGAGMYIIAACATVIIVLVQLFFHIPLRFFQEKHLNEIKVAFKSPTEDCPLIIKNLFDIKSFTEFKATRQGDEIIYCAVLSTKIQIDAKFIYNMINDYPFVISVEKTESDQ